LEKKGVLFTVKVPAGQEFSVMRLLFKRAEYGGLRIKSMIFVPGLKGYIFVESDREYDVRMLTGGVRRAKLLPGRPVSFEELSDVLIREPEVIQVKPGDIVKIVKGNFKGYRARVISQVFGGRGRKYVAVKLLNIDRDWEVQVPVDSIRIERRAEEAAPEREAEEWPGLEYEEGAGAEGVGKRAIKVLVVGGRANPGPPLGPALGGLGLDLGRVVREINEKTRGYEGMKVPVEIEVDPSTREYEIRVGLPPTSMLLLREVGAEKGSGETGRSYVGDVKMESVVKIAKMKLPYMNASSLKAAVKQVLGTAKSMGITVEGKDPREVIREVDEGVWDEVIGEGG